MDIDYLTLLREFSQLVWPIPRITALVLIVPVFSAVTIPARIRVIFILAMSFLCSSLVPTSLSLVNLNAWYLVYVLQEMALGFLMGFVLQLVFQIFVLAGQVISMQAGLGFAIMVDPATKVSVPLVGQFYLMLTTLTYLSLNGHLALLETLFQSFIWMPIGQVHLENSMVWDVIIFSGWMFKEAVLISIPAILTLQMVSLSLGIMTRVAPQLNIFSLGFPITLIIGMLVIKVTLPTISTQIVRSIEEGMNFIMRIFH